MVSHLVFYKLGLIALVWLFLILYRLWPSEPTAARPMPPKPRMRQCKRSKKPKPFPGLTRKPSCAACEQAIEVPRLQPSPPPPPTVTSTRGRRRHSTHSYLLSKPIPCEKWMAKDGEVAILFQDLYRILRCFGRYLSAIADAMIKAELRASKIV